MDDYQELQRAKDDNQMMNNIVQAYAQILQETTLASTKALQDEQKLVMRDHDRKRLEEKKRMEADKQKIRQKLGDDLFGDVYSYLVGQR